ncbi:hypothetical protein [Paludisphaera borealis]|uniref:hypothetical protein n=1 Tax=Paludisphaera borealis TaxID=1387353 RepID=UPI00143CFAE3|nr:hypothetical protein [Paludisphaera borealis]
MLLAVAGLGVAGAATFEEREILIRDPNNNAVRIKLTTNPENGSAGIEIYDRQGRRRIVLGTRADDDLPGLFYFDQNGNSKRQDND